MRSDCSEHSLSVRLGLLPTPAGCLQLPAAPWAQLVPIRCLLSFPTLPEVSSLLEKILDFLGCLVLNVTRICAEHLRLAGDEGRLESGSRGPRSRGVQGTPSSHHSSPLAVLLEPQRVPRYTPSQGERSTATPGSLHFASAFLRGRCSDSTMGRWPGGQDIPPRAGGDRTGTGRGLGCRARSPSIASCPGTSTRVVGCGWQT